MLPIEAARIAAGREVGHDAIVQPGLDSALRGEEGALVGALAGDIAGPADIRLVLVLVC